MELTQKEIKFLSILNETRLSDGMLSKRYFDEVKEQFTFSTGELDSAVKKLLKKGLLMKIDAGGGENVYFHTDEVIKIELDEGLSKIRH
jgi:hypothetical protein